LLEALIPGRAPVALTLDDPRDAQGDAIDATRHPEMEFSFACAEELPAGTVLRTPHAPR